MLATNVRAPAGEADLLADHQDLRWVVEVKTGLGSGSPIDRVDEAKHTRLWDLARQLGADRVLLVEVRLTRGGVRIGWSPG